VDAVRTPLGDLRGRGVRRRAIGAQTVSEMSSGPKRFCAPRWWHAWSASLVTSAATAYRVGPPCWRSCCTTFLIGRRRARTNRPPAPVATTWAKRSEVVWRRPLPRPSAGPLPCPEYDGDWTARCMPGSTIGEIFLAARATRPTQAWVKCGGLGGRAVLRRRGRRGEYRLDGASQVLGQQLRVWREQPYPARTPSHGRAPLG